MTRMILRLVLLIVCCAFSVAVGPVSSPDLTGTSLLLANILVGVVMAGFGLLLEWYLQLAPFRLMAGGAAGLVAGGLLARVILGALPAETEALGLSADATRSVVTLLFLLIGMLVGAGKGNKFRADKIITSFQPSDDRRSYKLLDTSVIIDGRIADICDTGFIDGVLVVPQFVLRELQYVADSADPLKRNRGRKGLDILQRIKRSPRVNVTISDTDFPSVREVDHKLIELARNMGAKILTNDFNLNKVAQLRGVDVLNINELANALRPVVLPGETMKVFILKEGKEPNQGVAYLDDGTMVVIDNARKQIGKSAEIIVTSVLQTTAGKMFFGRFASEFEKIKRPARERDPREAQESADKPSGSD